MFCNHCNQSRSSASAIALADELHMSKRKLDAVVANAVAEAQERQKTAREDSPGAYQKCTC
jgi:hypothetical protein